MLEFQQIYLSEKGPEKSNMLKMMLIGTVYLLGIFISIILAVNFYNIVTIVLKLKLTNIREA